MDVFARRARFFFVFGSFSRPHKLLYPNGFLTDVKHLTNLLVRALSSIVFSCFVLLHFYIYFCAFAAALLLFSQKRKFNPLFCFAIQGSIGIHIEKKRENVAIKLIFIGYLLLFFYSVVAPAVFN